MGSFSIWHWGVVLLVVLVVFGTSKLRNLGSDLGAAIKGFKDAMKEGEAEGKKETDAIEVKAEKTEKTEHTEGSVTEKKSDQQDS